MQIMDYVRCLCSGVIVAVGTLLSTGVADAAELRNLGVEDIDATYTYAPEKGVLGVLELNETDVAFVAELTDDTVIVGLADIFLSLELTGEIGDPNDEVGHGLFGPGLLTLTQNGGDPNPLAILFEADIDAGFELFEISGDTGAFQGAGTFSNAVYGADLDGVTHPVAGQVFALLFTWYTDEAKTQPINLQNYTAAQEPGTILYGDMTLDLVPEPSVLFVMVALMPWAIRRRRSTG